MKSIISSPRHVAFILDGNGRWAENRGLPRLEGHRVGVGNVRPTIIYLNNKGIEYTTLYAFSTENWDRPEDEVNGLFRLLESIIDKEARELHKHGVKIRHIGRLDGFSRELQDSIQRAVDLTSRNNGMTLVVALNYGGREEILNAIRRIIDDKADADKIDEMAFRRYLYTGDIPDVDLVIRTGGEIRTSNFMIWQTAYAEYYFTPVLWPDFNEEELEKALQAYGRRERRFGGL